MIGACDPCDCPESQDLRKALITIHMPEGWREMTPAQQEALHHVTCAHCGKILRYAGVRRSNRPGWNWETII